MRSSTSDWLQLIVNWPTYNSEYPNNSRVPTSFQSIWVNRTWEVSQDHTEQVVTYRDKLSQPNFVGGSPNLHKPPIEFCNYEWSFQSSFVCLHPPHLIIILVYALWGWIPSYSPSSLRFFESYLSQHLLASISCSWRWTLQLAREGPSQPEQGEQSMHHVNVRTKYVHHIFWLLGMTM